MPGHCPGQALHNRYSEESVVCSRLYSLKKEEKKLIFFLCGLTSLYASEAYHAESE